MACLWMYEYVCALVPVNYPGVSLVELLPNKNGRRRRQRLPLPSTAAVLEGVAATPAATATATAAAAAAATAAAAAAGSSAASPPDDMGLLLQRVVRRLAERAATAPAEQGPNPPLASLEALWGTGAAPSTASSSANPTEGLILPYGGLLQLVDAQKGCRGASPDTGPPLKGAFKLPPPLKKGGENGEGFLTRGTLVCTDSTLEEVPLRQPATSFSPQSPLSALPQNKQQPQQQPLDPLQIQANSGEPCWGPLSTTGAAVCPREEAPFESLGALQGPSSVGMGLVPFRDGPQGELFREGEEGRARQLIGDTQLVGDRQLIGDTQLSGDCCVTSGGPLWGRGTTDMWGPRCMQPLAEDLEDESPKTSWSPTGSTQGSVSGTAVSLSLSTVNSQGSSLEMQRGAWDSAAVPGEAGLNAILLDGEVSVSSSSSSGSNSSNNGTNSSNSRQGRRVGEERGSLASTCFSLDFALGASSISCGQQAETEQQLSPAAQVLGGIAPEEETAGRPLAAASEGSPVPEGVGGPWGAAAAAVAASKWDEGSCREGGDSGQQEPAATATAAEKRWGEEEEELLLPLSELQGLAGGNSEKEGDPDDSTRLVACFVSLLKLMQENETPDACKGDPHRSEGQQQQAASHQVPPGFEEEVSPSGAAPAATAAPAAAAAAAAAATKKTEAQGCASATQLPARWGSARLAA